MKKHMLRGSILGRYPHRGNPEDADCVGALAFGMATGAESVNARLARIAFAFGEHKPVMLEEHVAKALPGADEMAAKVISSGENITNVMGRKGSYGVLQEMHTYMQEHDLFRPLLVGQAHHIGRVAVQAELQGMNPIIPEGLPNQFDTESDQVWTRSRLMWIPFDLAGMVYLKSQGEL